MPIEHEQWQWQEPGESWKRAGLYHITLTIPSREPLLGSLVIPDNNPMKAKVERTELGNALVDCLLSIARLHPHVEVLHFCLMPDHLHAVLYVTHKIPKGIGSVIRGFWQASKKLGRASSFSPNGIRDNCREDNATLRERLGDAAYYRLPVIFSEMPFVRPMVQRRQLPATIRYIEMNPQRLATKRLMPGYFRVQDGIVIAERSYSGVGNVTLLNAERFAPVHVRRSWVEAAEHGETQPLRDYMNGCVLAARQGTVMVSPFISPKEKDVLNVLIREGLPFICLADNGFRDYYKPTDALFDACAAGKALILSPWEYDAKKRHITRAECVALNAMAEEIASCVSPNAIRGNSKKNNTDGI